MDKRTTEEITKILIQRDDAILKNGTTSSCKRQTGSKYQMGASSSIQTTNPQDEINQRLRDELAEQEGRAERNYEEVTPG